MTNFFLSLLVAIFTGSASGYLGSIMVLKRMALVGDALSHVALPGIGMALTYNINPFLGAFTALTIGILLIWSIERRTTIPTEALVGLTFAVSLAIGILITPEPELLEALFGDISKVQLADGIFAMAASLTVFILMHFIKEKLVLGLVSPDLAKSQKVKLELIDLLFLALVGTVVAIGVKVVGTLLMGALVVIPATAAKNIAGDLKSYGTISLTLGAVSALLGVSLASLLNLPPGPLVVLISAFFFLVTLVAKSSR